MCSSMGRATRATGCCSSSWFHRHASRGGVGLTWANVDLAARLVRPRTLARIDGELTVLEPKSAKSRRTIPLSDPAADALMRVRDRTTLERNQAAQLWVESNYVFVTDIGEPCDPRNALRALKATARRVGLDGMGLHTLRHSAASVMDRDRLIHR